MASFKDYLESRQQLISAFEGIPVVEVSYTPTKYGSLKINDTAVGIKCSYIIDITWTYETLSHPTPSHVKIRDRHNNVICEGDISMSSIKLQQWLHRNATIRQ